MYILKIEHFFDSAHFLKNHPGKCSNIHGHRWRIKVQIAKEKLNTEPTLEGMVYDFSDIKNVLKELVEPFDHALIIKEGSLREQTLNCLLADGFKVKIVAFVTTAENFSKYFFECLTKKGYPIKSVAVYETPTNCAVFEV